MYYNYMVCNIIVRKTPFENRVKSQTCPLVRISQNVRASEISSILPLLLSLRSVTGLPVGLYQDGTIGW